MSAEAKAMLDALMGTARNQSLATNTGSGGGADWDSLRTKKSCYDRDVCPLYCAWGVDVYELFTNTKSDLGPNPYVVSDDAREEFLGLPEHEKERLGFEHMLARKLGDLVRGCDRIVSRNKEKLRQEISKAARSRGTGATKIDPVTDVSDEMIGEAAEIMAELELGEEEVKEMLGKIMKIDEEWKSLWRELNKLQAETNIKNAPEDGNDGTNGNDTNSNGTEIKDEHKEDPESQEGSESKPEDTNDTEKEFVKKDEIDPGKEEEQDPGKEEATNNDSEKNNDATSTPDKTAEIQVIKTKLYKLSSEQQKLIATISNLTSQTIVPLRDNLQNITKQLFYVKTDMSSDKTVCEVSGNFMSSRDAEERIAAHYAGKQYVGWKMVREKFRELDKKLRSGGGGSGGMRGGPGMGGGGGGYGHGPPPSRHSQGAGGHRGRGGGYDHGPPPGYGGRSGTGGGGYGRDRDRSRDRDRDRDRDRWERDRGPNRGGGHHRGGGGYGRRR